MTEGSNSNQPPAGRIKRTIEALLFAVSEPLSLKKICEIFDSQNLLVTMENVEKYLNELKEEYIHQQKAFHIAQIGDGYLLRTNEEFRPYIDALFKKKQSDQLSQAALEVLSIIVFRQPITRAQIEEIRGVDSSGIIQSLLDKELIHISGKLEAPGRPALLMVTKDFLKYFGLADLSDLQSAPPPAL